MDPTIEHRVIQLLRDSPAPYLPVRRLYTALVAEGGPGAGGCARLVEHLQERGDVFVVVEPEHPLGAADGWPPSVRVEYEAELQAIGIDAGPFVTLAPRQHIHAARHVALDRGDDSGPTDDPLTASLAEIWDSSADHPDLRRAIVTALVDHASVPRSRLGYGPDE